MTLRLLEFAFLLYFALMNVWQAASLVVTVGTVSRNLRRSQPVRYKALLNLEAFKPVSLLVPAFNEEATIQASVQTLLNLNYPQFEIVVVCDGCTDGTLDVLKRAFALQPIHEVVPRRLKTAPLRQEYGSLRYPHLRVLDKLNGGKADALNLGLEYATYPLYCALDADSLLDEGALLRVARRFADNEHLIAVGGTVRPLNGAVIRQGQVAELHLPARAVEKFQVLEYVRAFLTGRTTLSAFSMLLIVSGAFGLFRREDVLRAGGYDTGTVGEDMELILRLHKEASNQGTPYDIEYMIDPICWTQVPDSWAALRRQRDRWHRGLLETLWRHRDMFINGHYGRIGLVALPYYVFFEALAPLLELAGYGLALYLLLSGQYSAPFLLLFLLLSVGYGTLLSVTALSVEVFLRQRYARTGDRLKLLGYALLDNLGYRQWTLLVRCWATVTVFFRAGQWGKQERQHLLSEGTAPAYSSEDRDG